MQQERLTKLKVIHIAGSKGKGSTAAMAEALLRSQGLKTGLFTYVSYTRLLGCFGNPIHDSSPHLIEVRERIRINGKPLSREDFADSFWQLHDLLTKNPDPKMQWPTYFRSTCLLAFLVGLGHAAAVDVEPASSDRDARMHAGL